MLNLVKGWYFKEDFNEGLLHDEAVFMDDFDMLDDYLYETYKDF